MSKFSHRQPVWTWSSVVLLSTLLLSPVATNTLLRALAHALPQNAGTWGSAPPAPEGTPAEQRQERASESQSPRRGTDEEEALRAAARNGQVRAVRLDSDPDSPDEFALFAPTRVLVRLPDAPATIRLRAGPETLPSAIPRSLSQPRAPPV
jgi:hypothetical protein